MTQRDSEQLVTDEVRALHVEFERWIGGVSDSLERVERALADDFLFIAPNGSLSSKEQLLDGLRQAHGSGALSIEIRNAAVKWEREDLICAVYEEWQTAGADTDPKTGTTTARQSSVVFEHDQNAPGTLRWLTVHETWLDSPA